MKDSNIIYKTEIYQHYKKEIKKLRREVIPHLLKKYLRKNKSKIALTFVSIFILFFSLKYIYQWIVISSIKYIPGTQQIIYKEHKNFNNFLNDLAFKESGNNYNIINKYGYMGKYQIGRQALIDIGLNVDNDVFIKNPELQEIAIRLLLKKNKKYLEKYIGKYSYIKIKKNYVTESGMLAASILGGSSSVIDFLESDGLKDFGDGNGTKISEYLREFEGYKMEY